LLGVIVGDEVNIIDPSTLEWIVQIREKALTISVPPTSNILALVPGTTINQKGPLMSSSGFAGYF
jgi:hypothetical protein